MLTGTDSENPAVLDIRAWADNRSPRLDDAIRHFELAWMALTDDRAQSLAEGETVARDRHYLLSVRRFRPFMLSPAEERALSSREASAGTAWQTLRVRTLGSLSARFDDGSGEREWPLSELESARRAHPDRDLRRRAQETTTALFEPVLPVIAHCYDSLVADRLAVDDLRGHDDPIDQANLENETRKPLRGSPVLVPLKNAGDDRCSVDCRSLASGGPYDGEDACMQDWASFLDVARRGRRDVSGVFRVRQDAASVG